ncbi:MarR family transcriptional regulator [Nonomuraea pusilla]|uniref:MarR family winged helix-turn-helix transcriptional regulator n=1 Tax=Nonomuraea pusilla TaxID=46177 RepID=UPI003333B88D
MAAATTGPEGLCQECGAELPRWTTGRPSRYCSPACRQRAYRARLRSGVTPAATEDGEASAHEREVPHLTERQLMAWRGMLEVESRILPLLDADLRRRADVTINEFDVLYQLWIAPGQRCRMKDLADAVLVTPSGITRMVVRLEERGLVRRVTEQGRQAVEAELTPEGERRLRQAMDAHFREVRRLFIDHLSETDVTRLVALWRRLRGNLPNP